MCIYLPSLTSPLSVSIHHSSILIFHSSVIGAYNRSNPQHNQIKCFTPSLIPYHWHSHCTSKHKNYWIILSLKDVLPTQWMLTTWSLTPSCRGSGCGRKSGSSCGHTSMSVHFSSNTFQCCFSWTLQCGFRTIHTHNAPVAAERAFYYSYRKAQQTSCTSLYR